MPIGGFRYIPSIHASNDAQALWDDYAANNVTGNASADTYGAWVELVSSTSKDLIITHLFGKDGTFSVFTTLQIGVGAASSEVVVYTLSLRTGNDTEIFTVPISDLFIPSGSRIAVRMKESAGGSIVIERVHFGGYYI